MAILLIKATHKELLTRKDGVQQHFNVGDHEVGPFGPILHQFKGDAQGAIKALTKLKTGEAVAALHHPEVGFIDLVWGQTSDSPRVTGFGLAKLLRWHPEVLKDLQGFISGLKVTQRHRNKIHLQDQSGGRAAVQLDWDGKQKHWLLTAYEKVGSGSASSADTSAVSTKGDTARLDPGPASSLPQQQKPINKRLT